MARRRTYSTDTVVAAAKDTFWRLGYEGAAISDLEAATGLSRSSLYQAFQSKEHLFAIALDAYIRGFIGPLLQPMESPDAEPDAAERFVHHLAGLFEGDGLSRRHGCLWINSISDLNGRDGLHIDTRPQEFWDRLCGAFANALRQAAGCERTGLTPAEHRARVLASATVGCWIAVRIDPERAVEGCDAMLAEMASWRTPEVVLSATGGGAAAGGAPT